MDTSQSQIIGWHHSPTTITLNWKPRFNSFRSIWEVIESKPTWLRGKTVAGEADVAGAAAMVEVVYQEGGEKANERIDRWYLS